MTACMVLYLTIYILTPITLAAWKHNTLMKLKMLSLVQATLRMKEVSICYGNSHCIILSWIHLYFAVPGLPTNLVAEPALDDCTQVTLRWSPPALDEQNGILNNILCFLLWYACIEITIMTVGVIRQYRIRAFGLDSSGFEATFVTSSTVQIVTDLRCCSDYRFSVSAFTIVYGPATNDMMFRTNPDLSSKQ